MKIKFFNYRVEFQARGAGHIHGVLWMDIEEIDKTFPGLKDIMYSLRNNEHLNVNQLAVLEKFVDTFVSCSLKDPNVKNIAKEVQVHKHTKTCKKKGTVCRFGFPRFPSKQTIIAQPLLQGELSEEEFEEKKSDAKKLRFTGYCF